MKRFFGLVLAVGLLTWQVGGLWAAGEETLISTQAYPIETQHLLDVAPGSRPLSACNGPAPDYCQPTFGLTGGFEFLFLSPHWQNNPAFSVLAQTGTQQSATQQSVTHQTDMDFGYQFSPRIWLGAQIAEGFGLRVTWWQLEQHGNVNDVVTNNFQANGTSNFVLSPVVQQLQFVSSIAGVLPDRSEVAAEGELRVLAWDFEATKEFTGRFCSGTVGFGVRYAHVSQDFRLFLVNRPASGPTGLDPTGTMISGHNFNGAGPTASVELTHSLGWGLGVYANARSSVLFGRGHHEVVTVTKFPFARSPGLINGNESTMVSQDVIPAFELEGGLEWGLDTELARVFARAGFEGQAWLGIGNTSDSERTTLGLFGATVSAGVQF